YCPVPAGPPISTLGPPAAAISSARLAPCWPLTSARSGPAPAPLREGARARSRGSGATPGARGGTPRGERARDVEQVARATDLEAVDERRLGGACLGEHQRAVRRATLPLQCQRHRESPTERARVASERQLARELGALEGGCVDVPHRREHAHGDGQVEAS